MGNTVSVFAPTPGPLPLGTDLDLQRSPLLHKDFPFLEITVHNLKPSVLPLVKENIEDDHDGGRSLGQIFNFLVPSEVETLIFSRLSLEDMKNMRLVCRRFGIHCGQMLNFGVVLSDKAEDMRITQGLTWNGFRVTKLVAGNLVHFKYPKSGLNYIDFVNELEIGPRNVAQQEEISLDNFKGLIEQIGPKLRRLSLNTSTFPEFTSISVLRSVNLRNLEELEIIDEVRNGNGDLFVIREPTRESESSRFEILRRQMRSDLFCLNEGLLVFGKLRRVYLRTWLDGRFLTPGTVFMLSFCFLMGNSKTLKDVTFLFYPTTFQSWEVRWPYTLHSRHYYGDILFPDLPVVQLNRLHFLYRRILVGVLGVGGRRPHDLLGSLILRQRKLKSFKLEVPYIRRHEVPTQLRDQFQPTVFHNTIRNNHETLEEIELKVDERWEAGMLRLSCPALSHCANLRSFVVQGIDVLCTDFHFIPSGLQRLTLKCGGAMDLINAILDRRQSLPLLRELSIYVDRDDEQHQKQNYLFPLLPEVYNLLHCLKEVNVWMIKASQSKNEKIIRKMNSILKPKGCKVTYFNAEENNKYFFTVDKTCFQVKRVY